MAAEFGMDAEVAKGGVASRTLLQNEGLRDPSSFCRARMDSGVKCPFAAWGCNCSATGVGPGKADTATQRFSR